MCALRTRVKASDLPLGKSYISCDNGRHNDKTMAEEAYHQRIREEKRTAAVQAAMELFLEQGYERTSLLQVAKRADLSTATLFKRFPTKAALFEAIVEEFWATESNCAGPIPLGNPGKALRKIGLDYAHRMRRPEMQAIYRLIVAEAQRFPDLGRLLFDKAKGPFLIRLKQYLRSEKEAGGLVVDDEETAALQFLGLIAGRAFWPELLGPGCGGDEAALQQIVEQATELMLARYGAPEP
jgi:TetR/AcrR family transcriptional regulator, regulator of autoinduction and epiphytic fitness